MRIKIVILCILPLLNASFLIAQEGHEILKFYSLKNNRIDSGYSFSIMKYYQTYKFVFPEHHESYFLLKDSLTMKYDTITETRSNSEFGPYKFIRRKEKIKYKGLSKNKKWRDLYEVSFNKYFLAPDLFSASEGYIIPTKLIDSNSILKLGEISFKCFKFLRKEDHDYSISYSIVFIDKITLLPLKFEYYQDEGLKYLTMEIISSPTILFSTKNYQQ